MAADKAGAVFQGFYVVRVTVNHWSGVMNKQITR